MTASQPSSPPKAKGQATAGAVVAYTLAPVLTLPRNLPVDNGHLGRFTAIL